MIQRIYYEQSSSAAFQLSKFHFKRSAIILSTSAAAKSSSKSWSVIVSAGSIKSGSSFCLICFSTNGHVIKPPPTRVGPPPYLGGVLIKFFLKISIKLTYLCTNYSDNSQHIQKPTIEIMKNTYIHDELYFPFLTNLECALPRQLTIPSLQTGGESR